MPKWRLRPAVVAGLEIAGAVEGQPRLGGRGQVGRAADQPRDILGDRVEDQAGGVRAWPSPCGRRGRPAGRIPALGELAVLHPVELVGQIGVLGPILLHPAEPGVAQFLPPPADALAEVVVDPVGHEELCVLGPSVIPLGEPDFVLAQRLAVGGAGVLLVGAPQPMWLSTMISVGRSRAREKAPKARSSRSRSLASPTRVTFQP